MWLLSPSEQKRDVVLIGEVVGPTVNRHHYDPGDFVEWPSGILNQQLDQAFVAELFSMGVLRFRDTISEGSENVAR